MAQCHSSGADVFGVGRESGVAKLARGMLRRQPRHVLERFGIHLNNVRGDAQTRGLLADEPGIALRFPAAELMVDMNRRQVHAVNRLQVMHQGHQGHRIRPSGHREEDRCAMRNHLVAIDIGANVCDQHVISRL